MEAVWAKVRASGPVERIAAANSWLSQLLRTGIPAQELPGWHDGLPARVRLIDWENSAPRANDFRLVAERRADDTAAPGPVLQVNGLPWVVIVNEPDAWGVIPYLVHRIRNLAGAGYGSVPAQPGLARHAQLLVVMDESDARLGTITSAEGEFAPWRTVAPATEEQVRAELGCPAEHPLRPWEILAAGVLRPSHLLDLVRNFVHEQEWPTGHEQRRWQPIKTVARYPQYRAVHQVTSLLADRADGLSGSTTARQAGVVRHFAGSGTVRTVSLLVRRLRANPQLAGHKIVVVTQRRNRERQIAHDLAQLGESAVSSPSANGAVRALALDVPDVLVLPLQKLGGVQSATGQPFDSPKDPPPAAVNTRSNILVILDEAHGLTAHHVRLRELLPHAAFLGFAEGPAPKRSQAAIQHLCGEPVDVYTAQDAMADGVLTPVLYERAVLTDISEASGANGGDLPARATRMFRHWAFTGLRHSVAAQVIAASRADAIRYCDALVDARNQLLAEIEALDPDLLSDPSAADYATAEERALLDLWNLRHVLKRIEPRAAITVGTMDPPEWRRWTGPARGWADGLAEAVAERPPDPSWGANPHDGVAPGTDPKAGAYRPTPGASHTAHALTGFTAVRSKLEEVENGAFGHLVFLDRRITAAELRQIMRARRPGDAIHHVVDHAEAIPSLERAFACYAPDHLRDVLGLDAAPHWGLCKDRGQAVAEVLWRVHGELRRFLAVSTPSGSIDSLHTEPLREDLLAALADPLVHARFIGLVRQFLAALNSALPTKAEPRYVELAGWLGIVQYVAWKRHRPDSDYFEPRASGVHVDDLIERRLEESDTRYLVPPERMTAPDFLERVTANTDPRARAAYLLYAVLDHLTFRPLANALRQQLFDDQLTAIMKSGISGSERTAEALLALARNILAAEHDHAQAASEPALTPLQRVLLLLEQAVPGQRRSDGAAPVPVRAAAEAITSKIAHEARLPHLGLLEATRNRLRKELRQVLEKQLRLDWSATGPLATRLVELAVERQEEFADHTPDRATTEHTEVLGAVVLPWPGGAEPSGTNM
ncbi:hypothetical protein O3Q52_00605 [Streptomyces sp. ActVer]|uniref:hypothetical protein n=1 Tax=Streptomyces sp. ActVer TaxID=3014558 RepID=UPI0022B39D0E|nr:hypothetical protein [Streptomyces sp. ActVer]MCZ4506730.1 hypothetical protein [Streptomyces sp. ActVer]